MVTRLLLSHSTWAHAGNTTHDFRIELHSVTNGRAKWAQIWAHIMLTGQVKAVSKS